MIYEEWGFRDNPFQTSALPPSKLGAQLMVGRADFIAKLKRRIQNFPKIATVEGPNGIGKTSLANVVAFQLYDASLKESANRLYIPCRSVFQLRPDETAAQFRRRVLLEVAQTLIENRNDLPVKPGFTSTRSNKALDVWLNSPRLRSISAGLANFSIGSGAALNEGDGFTESGLDKAIIELLSEVFDDPRCGGIICVIDNLELLRESKLVRQRIEELRDSLLSIRGLRWVLCGSMGIVNGVATSPILQGYFHNPIVLTDLPTHLSGDLLDARINTFEDCASPFLPLSKSNFQYLFDVFRGNLRSTLSTCDEFCEHFVDLFGTDERAVRPALFGDWVTELGASHYRSITAEIPKQAARLFDLACKEKKLDLTKLEGIGVFDGRDLDECLEVLGEEGLILVIQNEENALKRTVQVSTKGQLLRHHLVVELRRQGLWAEASSLEGRS